ncbi:MAG: hypothetical protein SF162_02345 [bacterium]|nr:hypothetical protein [bacterium]
MTFDNTGSLPWMDRMRRVESEWLAPDDVVSQVCAHYVETTEWMNNAMLSRSARLWALSPHYLSGIYLQRCHDLLLEHKRSPRAIGILRSDHRVEARFFAPNGGYCHLIDYQTGRRMATYDPTTMERITTQDMGASAIVYFMRYDLRDHRWKINAFVQELPITWQSLYLPIQRPFSGSAHHIGRDH